MKPETERALLVSGWHPGRRYDIRSWVDMLGRGGLTINSRALEVWSEYGGLYVVGESANGTSSFLFDPIQASDGMADDAMRLTADYGENLSPLGVWSEQYPSYIAETGWVMAIGPGWDWELGRSLMDALDMVVTVSREIKCIKVTAPGARPYPPNPEPS